MAMMISKFNKIIRSKIIWGTFAVLISVAFVFAYTPGSKNRSQARRDARQNQLAGRLFGEDVTRIELSRASNAVRALNAALNPYNRMSNEEVYNRAWDRLLLLKKAEQMGLDVTEEMIPDTIQQIPMFQNRNTGQYDENIYAAFTSQVLTQLYISPAGFEQIIKEYLLIGQVYRMAGQCAIATETEIKKAFHLLNDKLTVEYATIPYSLAAAPEVTEDDAKSYFERNPQYFILPEAVKVDYVRFAAADYLDTVEATDEMVTGYYEKNKQRYLKELAEDAPEDAVAEFKPLEEVKEEIVSEIKQDLALKAALDQADSLVSDLANRATTFDQASSKMGAAVVKNTPAFSLEEAVAGIPPTDTTKFAEASHARQITSNQYYSNAVEGKDTVYVIALLERIPPEMAEFEAVKDDVFELAKLTATDTAYNEMANQLQSDILTAVKAGTSFADAVTKHKMELKTTEPFDFSAPLDIDFGDNIQSATAWLDQGQVTGLIGPVAGDEFLVAYVAEKIIADESGLPMERADLARRIASEKSGSLAGAWHENLRNEAKFEDLFQQNDDES